MYKLLAPLGCVTSKAIKLIKCLFSFFFYYKICHTKFSQKRQQQQTTNKNPKTFCCCALCWFPPKNRKKAKKLYQQQHAKEFFFLACFACHLLISIFMQYLVKLTLTSQVFCTTNYFQQFICKTCVPLFCCQRTAALNVYVEQQQEEPQSIRKPFLCACSQQVGKSFVFLSSFKRHKSGQKMCCFGSQCLFPF